MMLTTDDSALKSGRGRHRARERWLDDFTSLGNAPTDYHQALEELGRLRASARYGSPPLNVSVEHARELTQAVTDLVSHARLRLEG